jgi:CheY-like chemotaxis protein
LRVVHSDVVVLTDRALFERLLRNLISNAIRYTAEGRVLVGCRRHNGHFWVEVWDSGIGIAEPQRRRIFEEFQRLGNEVRRNEKGVGLGLAIVDRISKLLGLDVSVTSTVGKGSCFAVRVPLGDSVAASFAERVVEEAEIPDFDRMAVGKTVLVIDNDLSSLAAVSDAVRSWQWEAVEAASGWIALEEVARMPGEGRSLDLIVADYNLDGDERGTDAIAAVRQAIGREVPAMIITGDRSVALRAKLREMGLGYLAKPLKPGRLRTLLNYLVNTAETD